jgi:hypothetical protein
VSIGIGIAETNEEQICTWMEPNFATMDLDDLQWHGLTSRPEGWWRISGPRQLTLDALYEVEERLIALGYRAQIDEQFSFEVWSNATAASTWHATAAQKIAALARVIKAVK